MVSVTLRFYEELNDFLPREKRKRRYTVESAARRSVKDLIEAEGVPHTEVDLILVNGHSCGFETLLHDRDDISVFPVFETLDIGSVSRLDRAPLRSIRFVADVHLGKLARRLRLLGFDCLFNAQWDDADLARISAQHERVLLSRDRGLLMRNNVTHAVYVRSDQPVAQCREVLKRLNLFGQITPWSRCVNCNGELVTVPKEQVKHRVPGLTYQWLDQFRQCQHCGQVYWQGSHWHRLQRFIDDLRQPSPENRP